MGNADISEDADVRARDFCKACHFTEAADSHFKNCNLMFFTEIKNSKRKSDFVIKVTFCFQNRIFLREDRCDHLFCTCFSDTSRNAYDFDIKGTAVMFGNVF